MISVYIILFFIYSFLGWIMEVLNSFVYTKKFVNRGFCIGPLCPIYGVGVLLIILLLNRYMNEPIVLFVMSMLICSILEYFTSYIMEKIFKARWWDYSNRKFNINGRVCLETMIPFGILGTFMVYIVNPFFIKILDKIDIRILNIISIILICIFILDLVFSFKTVFKFKNTLKKYEKDNTIEVSKKVKEILLSGGFLTKRLVKAFPLLKSKIRSKMKIK